MVITRRYTEPAAAFRDPGITAKAKGILAYLESADGEHMTIERMEGDMAEGIGALRRGIKELEAAGYLKRERKQVDGAAAYDWILYL